MRCLLRPSNKFAMAVKEATGGVHTVKVFHSAQLGNEAEVIRQMQSGTVDFSLMTVSELATRVPEFNLLLAPGLVTSNEHAARLLSEGKIPQKMLGLLEQRIGIKGLAFGMAGVTQVMANFDAGSPADLAGKRVRITPSPAILEFNKIIGSAPVPIPLPGVYDAFANGQVDAMETNLDIMRVLKVEDHAETLLISNQGMFPAAVVVSMRTWKGLSENDQSQLAKLVQDYAQGVITATLEVEKKSRAHFDDLA
ncbi:MAG: TRAP transporter substrate-binding protein, partial [Sneathiellales bacterium]|nr:TRAP transporter substrate-binding protein [Sneathiellales bacterium]